MKCLIVFATFSCFFALSKQNVSARQSLGGRIIGGQEARSGQFPFAAGINVETSTSTFFCGGALVTDQWILTAGHCIDGAVTLSVQLGSNSLTADDSNRIIVNTNEVVVHPDYDGATLANDIGLVRLPEPVQLSEFIQTIRLASINLPSILTPTAIGWGQTSGSGPDLSSELNFVTLSIISNAECRQTYGDQITDTMLCLVGSGNQGACAGDSGSPLVVRLIGGTQLEHVGISSFVSGNGCDTEDPSGYTRTYPYVDWIRNVTAMS